MMIMEAIVLLMEKFAHSAAPKDRDTGHAMHEHSKSLEPVEVKAMVRDCW